MAAYGAIVPEGDDAAMAAYGGIVHEGDDAGATTPLFSSDESSARGGSPSHSRSTSKFRRAALAASLLGVAGLAGYHYSGGALRDDTTHDMMATTTADAEEGDQYRPDANQRSK